MEKYFVRVKTNEGEAIVDFDKIILITDVEENRFNIKTRVYITETFFINSIESRDSIEEKITLLVNKE